MPKKVNSEVNKNLPAKSNKIGLALDPYSNIAQAVDGVVSSISGVGKTYIQSGESKENQKELTKQIDIQANAYIAGQKELTTRETQLAKIHIDGLNKSLMIQGAFDVAKGLVNCLDGYLNLLNEKELTKRSEDKLNEAKEKTRQVESKTESEIEKSRNKLKEVLAKYRVEEKNIELEQAQIIAIVDSCVNNLKHEMQDTITIVDELKKERGISDPLTLSFINKRTEINDKLVEAAKIIRNYKS